MATLLDALSQENLDNQREVVKNEKRQSYDNRPYGSFYEKLMAAVFPAEHPYHHTPIGSMEDLDAASLEDVSSVLPGLVRAQQRGADDRGRRGRGGCVRGPRSAGSGPSRPTRTWAGRGRRRCPRSSAARSARWCPTRCPWCGSTWATAARPTARHDFDALEVGTQILAGGRGSRLYQRLVREERVAQDVAAFTLPLVGGASIAGGLGDGTTRERRGDRGADVARGDGAPCHGAGQRRRAGPGPGAHRVGRAGCRGSRGGGRRPALAVRHLLRPARSSSTSSSVDTSRSTPHASRPPRRGSSGPTTARSSRMCPPMARRRMRKPQHDRDHRPLGSAGAPRRAAAARGAPRLPLPALHARPPRQRADRAQRPPAGSPVAASRTCCSTVRDPG